MRQIVEKQPTAKTCDNYIFTQAVSIFCCSVFKLFYIGFVVKVQEGPNRVLKKHTVEKLIR